MYFKQRIDLLVRLGEYCLSGAPAWEAAKQRAHAVNGWFIPEFIEVAVAAVAKQYLQREKLEAWVRGYATAEGEGMERVAEPAAPKTVGLTMAGNIPLVGFHDLLTIFVSGHRQLVKPSSRDEVLIRHLVEKMIGMDGRVADRIGFAERLNGCDAYIATGSNNSARYFEYYFGKYPHLIRRNRTSVAVLTGEESREELEALADDVNLYFGLGCRNVTQIAVPEGYDFLRLLDALKKYHFLADLSKYKHNFDYQLTLLILNKKFYMTNGSILLTENASPFSPISVLNYVYYQPGVTPPLPEDSEDIQCIVGRGAIPFGRAQQPGLTDYADGVDTMAFLMGLG
jgi:hypothetical protein